MNSNILGLSSMPKGKVVEHADKYSHFQKEV
jgi:hypothetical protein